MSSSTEMSRTRELLVRRLHRRKSRSRERLYLAEGIRCAHEALAAGARVKFAVRSSRFAAMAAGERLAAALERAGIEQTTVDDAQLSSLSGTDAPQGILLVCEQPRVTLADIAPDPTNRVLVLDGIQDPGNLGTLIRTAAAFELGAVIALEGCVDPYNPKTVRASAGSVARLPIVTANWEGVEPWLRSTDWKLLVATANGKQVGTAPGHGWALVIGNEGAGARPAIVEAADRTVGVSISRDVESLNAGVAGAILMYALCG